VCHFPVCAAYLPEKKKNRSRNARSLHHFLKDQIERCAVVFNPNSINLFWEHFDEMLNTFENADRHHLRRKERERHMALMESFANGSVSDDQYLFGMADALSGFPLEKMQENDDGGAKPCKKQRAQAFCKKHMLLLMGVVMVLVASLCFRLGFDFGEHEELSDTKNVRSKGRRHRLHALILEWGVTPVEVLDDEVSAPARALDWLAFEDNSTDDVDALRTRFALATLYFATQQNADNTVWDKDDHWLSQYPVCLWHGIDCVEGHDLQLGLVETLNLSANGLSGYIPPELGLLQTDIKSLDLSDNSIKGSIPESLVLMQNLGEFHMILQP